MHGNLTTAAWIFGGSLVIASLVLVLGVYFIVQTALDRADATTLRHAAAIEQTGNDVGSAIRELSQTFETDIVAILEGHAGAVESAGTTIGQAFEDPLQVSVATPDEAPLTVQLGQPLQLDQPVVIEGTLGEDRSVSVQASIFE